VWASQGCLADVIAAKLPNSGSRMVLSFDSVWEESLSVSLASPRVAVVEREVGERRGAIDARGASFFRDLPL
jgi:hypothetical protein